MKPSFVVIALACSVGIASILALSTLPTYTTIYLVATGGVLLAAGTWQKNLHPSLYILAIALLAFDYGCLRAKHALANRLDSTKEGYYQLIGTVESIPITAPGYSQVQIHVQKLTSLNRQQLTTNPKSVRLNWYNAQAPWHCSETWDLLVKLKPPRSIYNPASFDQEAWYLAHGIDALGYVNDADKAKLLDKGSWWQISVNQLRERLNQRILMSCQKLDGCAQVQAITIGQRDQFSQQDWQMLQATGTNHLFAIAGLHIGLVASACFWISKHIWRCLPRLPLWLPAPTIGWFGALLGACAYSALAGFALPTQRACLMLVIIALARLGGRSLPPWHAWALALVVILVYQPMWILDTSLWLSFGTVALLIFSFANRWPKATSHRQQFLRLQWLLSVGLWPLTAYYFQNLNTVGLVANLFTIPWIALTILPCCLTGALICEASPQLASVLWQAASHQLHWLKQGLILLSHLSYSQWPVSFHSVWPLMLGCFGVLLLLAPKAVPARWLGLCYCYAALCWPKPQPPPHALWLSLLDVGQGLSVLAQTQHHALVFDTGSRFSEQDDMGLSVVIPALKAAGIRHLDTLVISHADNDHAGGVSSVTAFLPIDHFFTSDIARLSELVPTAPWQACRVGQHWRWDDVDFEFLYPSFDSQQKPGNDCSCVLRISTSQQQLLLTGDIEKFSENYLIEHQKTRLASNVLVVPHHGSKTSSTSAFVLAVKPDIALFPLGYHNKFHFPHLQVVHRYQAIHTNLYDTAMSGQINVILDPDSSLIPVTATRLQHPPFWRVP